METPPAAGMQIPRERAPRETGGLVPEEPNSWLLWYPVFGLTAQSLFLHLKPPEDSVEGSCIGGPVFGEGVKLCHLTLYGVFVSLQQHLLTPLSGSLLIILLGLLLHCSLTPNLVK